MKGRRALYYLLWPLDLLFWPFGRRDRKGEKEREEDMERRRRPHSSRDEWAEFILVCLAPPLFLFYLMGWRPLTGNKEGKS